MAKDNQQPSFQELVANNRSAGRLGRPTAPKDYKMKPTGMRLLPQELSQAKQLAEQEERSAASFIRRVYLRGLAIYLDETGTASTPAASQ